MGVWLAVVPALLGSAVACAKREPTERDTAPPASVREAPASVREAPAANSDYAGSVKETDSYAAERRRLADQIKDDGVRDPRVLAAMARVPRHLFVPDSLRDEAYRDRPLPIGSGQTISQPYVVAAMSEAAEIQSGENCLEVGTGSGYQAAVLAELCKKVHSIEYLADVARFGERNLRRAGYGPDRVVLRVGDGYAGWREAAPFDAILVTAAPERVPPPLLAQLRKGGHMIIPVGPDGEQWLERWTRRGDGTDPKAFQTERLMGVRFVPFLGDGGS
jgi:protein-L-isoaspartate(D-aspartate) O-methyltransferase